MAAAFAAPAPAYAGHAGDFAGHAGDFTVAVGESGPGANVGREGVGSAQVGKRNDPGCVGKKIKEYEEMGQAPPVDAIQKMCEQQNTPAPRDEYYCLDGARYRNGVKIYDAPYRKCVDVETGWATSLYALCPIGWEVWRFYGTVSDPVKAWSVSRINFADWCEPNAPVLAIAPNPMDAGRSGFSPWVSSQGTNRRGQKYYVAAGRYTTVEPFRRSGDPVSLLSDQGMIAEWVAQSEASQAELSNAARSLAAGYGWPLALQMTNLSSVSPFRFGDGVALSSGVEFAGQDPQVVYGVCMIPVERRAQRFENSSKSWWEYPTAGGARYDVDKFPYRYSSDPKPYHAAWRNAIYDEVMSRPGTPLYDVPGAPYPGNSPFFASRDPGPRSQAAAAARDFSRCEDGVSFYLDGLNPPPGDTPTTDTPPPGTPGSPEAPLRPNAYVTVEVDSPDYFFTAGTSATQRVSAEVGEFVCRGCRVPGAPQPRITSLEYTLSVAPSGGYDDLRVVSQRTSGQAQFVDLQFFAPTNPSQKMQVRVLGARARYVYYPVAEPVYEQRTYTVRIDVEPVRVTVNVRVGTSYPPSYGDLPVIVVGAPVDKDVIGATALPRG